METRAIAQLLAETADVLEIANGDPFRIRSYRRAAEAVEQSTIALSTIASDPKRLLEIPGIGKGMAANIQSIEQHGSMPLRDDLLTRYKPTMLELLKLPGMGPKTVSLIFEATGVASVDELAIAIDEGRLANLPRVGEKLIQKLRKGIDEYRKNTGRFHLDDVETAAEALALYLKDFAGVESVT